MRTSRVGALTCALALVAVVLWPADARAQAKTAAAMLQAANAFLASLTPDQRAKASLSFDDPERFVWQEAPGIRSGVVLRDLNEAQRKLAIELLRTGVGEGGSRRIQMSMAREPVPSALQQTPQGQALRAPDLFYITIFGTPSATTPWAWTLEGHHISTHFTIRGTQVSTAPMFLGSQPNDLPAAKLTGAASAAAEKIPAALAGRILADEEDKARAMVQALDAKQRGMAVFDRSEKRDADMISGINTRRVAPLGSPGVFARQMTAQQKTLLVALVEVYLSRFPADVAADRRRRLLEGAALDEISFQWAGSTDAGRAHAYIVQGPAFLAEYAQNRNDAVGHVHTVWREFSGDFGGDFLGTR
ncbi:MAG: DUF3500 domain-containing protein [Acidobacteria bacterium]|nr:DUF3500 domain-containing protein [Acidobacteriota bacterium]